MFTYPIISAGASSPFSSSEHMVIMDSTGNLVRYVSVDVAGGSFVELDSFAQPYTNGFALATDGTFLFMPTTFSGDIGQYAWDGANITKRFNATGGSSNVVDEGMYIPPNNVGYVSYTGSLASSHGLSTNKYESSPTYSYGVQNNYTTGNDNWGPIMDFRVGEVGTAVYGSTIVPSTKSVTEDLRSFTISGTAYTTSSSVSHGPTGYDHGWGWERDLGTIAALESACNTNVQLYQLNMGTRVMSSIGTGTTTATVYAVTFVNSHLVTHETSGVIRTYSLSGSTLTEVDSLSVGGAPSISSFLTASPFTNKAYLISSGVSRVLDIGIDGTITTKLTLSSMYYNAGGGNRLVFLASALPTV